MKLKATASLTALAVLFGATGASAQLLPRSPILDIGSKEAMRGEVERRYEAALQSTLAPDVVRANDERFVWASEAKVACGIAIGYLKTGTVHEESINKCDDFSRRMDARPISAPAPAPAPAMPKAECAITLPVPIFFDWNVDVPPPEARETLARIAGSMETCGRSALSVIGHADRSGSERYNLGLSERRARNVANELMSAGVPSGSLIIEAKGESAPLIQTVDGVREPQNRRVEIHAASRP